MTEARIIEVRDQASDLHLRDLLDIRREFGFEKVPVTTAGTTSSPIAG